MSAGAYADRKTTGDTWEATVITWLNDQPGTYAEPFGQALLTWEMRQRLISYRPPSRIRWMPDAIVAAPGGIGFVDAKASDATMTGRHAVESASTLAAVAFQNALGHPITYAFPHTDGPRFVPVDVWRVHAKPGPPSRSGSGTPYALGSCEQLCRVSLGGVA